MIWPILSLFRLQKILKLGDTLWGRMLRRKDQQCNWTNFDQSFRRTKRSEYLFIQGALQRDLACDSWTLQPSKQKPEMEGGLSRKDLQRIPIWSESHDIPGRSQGVCDCSISINSATLAWKQQRKDEMIECCQVTKIVQTGNRLIKSFSCKHMLLFRKRRKDDPEGQAAGPESRTVDPEGRSSSYIALRSKLKHNRACLLDLKVTWFW